MLLTVIVVLVLAIDAITPILVLALDLEDALLLALGIPIDAREMLEAPFEVRIFVTSAGKGEFRPTLRMRGTVRE